MLEIIMSLLGSSAVGSVIGGIFAFLNRKADAEAKRLDMEHERAKWGFEATMRDKDLEIAKAEAQGKKEVAIIEGEALVGAAQLKAIADVQVAERVTADEIKAAGKWGFLFVWVSVWIKSIRPTLTVLVGTAALVLNIVLIWLMAQNWSQFSTDTWFQFGQQALTWVTAQASMMFGYWFVSRGVGK